MRSTIWKFRLSIRSCYCFLWNCLGPCLLIMGWVRSSCLFLRSLALLRASTFFSRSAWLTLIAGKPPRKCWLLPLLDSRRSTSSMYGSFRLSEEATSISCGTRFRAPLSPTFFLGTASDRDVLSCWLRSGWLSWKNNGSFSCKFVGNSTFLSHDPCSWNLSYLADKLLFPKYFADCPSWILFRNRDYWRGPFFETCEPSRIYFFYLFAVFATENKLWLFGFSPSTVPPSEQSRRS